jgi:hypothetical protein
LDIHNILKQRKALKCTVEYEVYIPYLENKKHTIFFRNKDKERTVIRLHW